MSVNLRYLPKFLTPEVAKQAIQVASTAVKSSPLLKVLKRQSFHVFVLVPEVRYKSEMTSSGEEVIRTIQPHILYQKTVGNKKTWTGSYFDIAYAKANQLWDGRQCDGTDIEPHLLKSGDTIYWGGVKRQGIVVSCSGVQPYFDRLIAGIIADTCIALAYHAWKLHKAGKDGDKDFLD